MKKNLFFLLAFFLFWEFAIIDVAAENGKNSIKFNSLSLSSGEGVLSSGLFFESNFSRGNDQINFYLGGSDLAISYLKSFLNKKLFIGPALEFYMNLPTLGAQMIFLPIKNLSSFSWIGFSAGAPGNEADLSKWQYLFYYQSLDYSYKRFTFSTIALQYNNCWQPIIDIRYRQSIMKNVELFGSAGYKFYKEGHSLFKLGIIYKK